MGIIIALLIAVAIFGIISYFMQYNLELNSNPEQIIKDGLIKELIERTVNDTSIPFIIKENEIVAGRFAIRQTDGTFWFPYYVYKTALPYHERKTDDDWDKKIGYVRWLSKDWKLINDLLKKNKKPIEQKQRQKLNLEK